MSVLLAQSLEDLVDSESPQNVLKFRLVCDYSDGEDTVIQHCGVLTMACDDTIFFLGLCSSTNT